MRHLLASLLRRAADRIDPPAIPDDLLAPLEPLTMHGLIVLDDERPHARAARLFGAMAKAEVN